MRGLRIRIHAPWRLVSWLWLALSPLVAGAEMLNRIEVKTENDVGVIHIVLTRPVVYTHHFPIGRTSLIHIYFNDSAGDIRGRAAPLRGAGEVFIPSESMKSPPNTAVPDFWVYYRNMGGNDLGADPFHLQVQFSQPINYKLVPDDQGQGFLIFVLNADGTTPPKKPRANLPESSGADSNDRRVPQ